MTPYQLILFTAFFVIAALMVIDKNVAEYFNLTLQLISVKIRTWFLMAKLHPKNPVTNFIMARKMKKLSRELQDKWQK